MSAVAAELQVAKSTMTGMVSRMREAGLVTLQDDEHDRRTWRLKLTPLARSLKPHCLKLAEEMESLLSEKLTAAEREQFRRALGSVTQTIAERLESGDVTPATRFSLRSVRACDSAELK